MPPDMLCFIECVVSAAAAADLKSSTAAAPTGGRSEQQGPDLRRCLQPDVAEELSTAHIIAVRVLRRERRILNQRQRQDCAARAPVIYNKC